jgi:phage protein U
MLWGALGSIEFGFCEGPSSETLKTGVKYAPHDRLGRAPTRQLVGRNLQTVEWTISLHRQTTPDLENLIATLKTSMEKGEILDLTYGDAPDTGIWAGQWTIDSLDIDSLTRAPGGALFSANLKIKLTEWVQREDLIVSKRQPPAVKPTGSKPAPPPPTGPGYP